MMTNQETYLNWPPVYFSEKAEEVVLYLMGFLIPVDTAFLLAVTSCKARSAAFAMKSFTLTRVRFCSRIWREIIM